VTIPSEIRSDESNDDSISVHVDVPLPQVDETGTVNILIITNKVELVWKKLLFAATAIVEEHGDELLNTLKDKGNLICLIITFRGKQRLKIATYQQFEVTG